MHDSLETMLAAGRVHARFATHAHLRALSRHEMFPRLSVPTQAYVPQVGPFSSGGTVKSVYGSSWQASTHASSAMSVRASVRNCW